MTFKHINFSDSEIMRSFEKVAHNKKMIKAEEPQIKSASVLNTVPTNNFNENILKLCNVLRDKGFISQAEELETNFINYKSAELKDPGEKRVEDSHDKSPRFGDSEYGVIENILEEHKKILDVVRKKPTGKLASNNDIIKAVKNILAEDVVEGVEFGEFVFDYPKKDEVTGVEIGDPEIYYVDFDPEPEVSVDIGEPIIDESHNKVAGLKKNAQEITDAHRKSASKDTLKKAIPHLRSSISSFRSIDGMDLDDANKFDGLINSVVQKIEHFVPSLKELSSIISSINSLKESVRKFRDDWWDWMNRPLFSNDEHKAKFTGTFNHLNKALLQAQTAYDVLNGVRDDDLRKLLQTTKKTLSGEKELSKFKSKLEDWIAWFRLTKPFESEESNEKASKYIEKQFLNKIKNIEEYFNRIKSKNPQKANDFIISEINKIKNSSEYLTVLKEWHPGVA